MPFVWYVQYSHRTVPKTFAKFKLAAVIKKRYLAGLPVFKSDKDNYPWKKGKHIVNSVWNVNGWLCGARIQLVNIFFLFVHLIFYCDSFVYKWILWNLIIWNSIFFCVSCWLLLNENELLCNRYIMCFKCKLFGFQLKWGLFWEILAGIESDNFFPQRNGVDFWKIKFFVKWEFFYFEKWFKSLFKENSSDKFFTSVKKLEFFNRFFNRQFLI